MPPTPPVTPTVHMATVSALPVPQRPPTADVFPTSMLSPPLGIAGHCQALDARISHPIHIPLPMYPRITQAGYPIFPITCSTFNGWSYACAYPHFSDLQHPDTERSGDYREGVPLIKVVKRNL